MIASFAECAGERSNLTIANVVASANVCGYLPVDRWPMEEIVTEVNLILSEGKSPTYENVTCTISEKLKAIILRFKDPKATVIATNRGRVRCMGANSTRTCCEATKASAELLIEAGKRIKPRKPEDLKLRDLKLNDYKVRNIVAWGNVGHRIRVEDLAKDYPFSSKRETSKEAFNSDSAFRDVSFTVTRSKVSVRIFESGKIHLLGAIKQQRLDEAFEKVANIVSEYRAEECSQLASQAHLDEEERLEASSFSEDDEELEDAKPFVFPSDAILGDVHSTALCFCKSFAESFHSGINSAKSRSKRTLPHLSLSLLTSYHPLLFSLSSRL